MKRLFKFKYPKLTLLIILILIAYYIFSNPVISESFAKLESLSYFGIFFAGLLFSFGFTTPFAIALFLVINPGNILFASFIGGIGALISDTIIFKIIKFSYMEEFERLEASHPAKKLSTIIRKSIKAKIRAYLLYFFAGIIIASPLPDELGVTMLAGLTHIKLSVFTLISLIMNSIGIFIFLLIGRVV